MRPAQAGNRRHLPTSPFKERPAPPPDEQYDVNDQVTHDKHGLGVVVGVESGVAVVVDFGPHRARILAPYTKLTKL
jgi:hypothetical protein